MRALATGSPFTPARRRESSPRRFGRHRIDCVVSCIAATAAVVQAIGFSGRVATQTHVCFFVSFVHPILDRAEEVCTLVPVPKPQCAFSACFKEVPDVPRHGRQPGVCKPLALSRNDHRSIHAASELLSEAALFLLTHAESKPARIRWEVSNDCDPLLTR